MFKIALVQNVSEMRNYAYADIRGMLSNMGFDVVSITRDNIDNLAPILHGALDCVLFASNSLNDDTIYEYVCTETFIISFNSFLENGGSTIVLHQKKLCNRENPLPFLGIENLCIESSYAGKKNDDADNFLNKEITFSEQYFMFPNKLSIEQVNKDCTKVNSLSGYYWELLKGQEEDWTPILIDKSETPVIQRANDKKVVFSSVLLDFQGHVDLLHNILINLMIDGVSLAVYEKNDADDLGFEYFLNSVSRQKIYYKRYKAGSVGLRTLIDNIKLGLHGVVIVNTKAGDSLPQELEITVEKYGVKIIVLEACENGTDSFEVRSMDRNMANEFFKTELQIQEELPTGFVSNSFMKTIDVLMKLKEFEYIGKTKGTYTTERVAHVLSKAKEHIEEDGSYDETFGASCKALWLFYTFCGEKDPYTQKCKKYVQKYSSNGNIRDDLEKYYVLSMFEKDSTQYIKDHCSKMIQNVINDNFNGINEFDLLQILKVALKSQDEEILIQLFEHIKSYREKKGNTLDLYVTSIMSSYLIDMYNSINKESKQVEIRTLLFDFIMFLRNHAKEAMFVEDKIQYICALYKFESELSFPTRDLIDLISGQENYTRDSHIYEKQITIFEKSRERIDDIVSEKTIIEEENKGLRLYKKGFFVTLSILVIVIYVAIYLLFILDDTGVALGTTLFNKIKETWLSLFSLLIIPAFSFIFKRFIKKEVGK